MPTTPVTDATLAEAVNAAGDKPVLVCFWATWCGPCRAFAPTLEAFADELPDDLLVVKVNIDENPRATEAFQVMAVPTTVLLQGGEDAGRFSGAVAKPALQRFLAERGVAR